MLIYWMGTQITSSRRGLLGCEWRAVYVGYLTNNDDERTGVTLKQEVVNENVIGPTRGRLAGRRQWARELDGGDWNGWDVRIFVYSAKLSPPPITHSIITFMTPGNQIIRRICMFVYEATTWRVSNLAGGWTGWGMGNWFIVECLALIIIKYVAVAFFAITQQTSTKRAS